jgi:hypothetical protein
MGHKMNASWTREEAGGQGTVLATGPRFEQSSQEWGARMEETRAENESETTPAVHPT